ncbi:MAG TPA: ATP synthase F1 subunit gamma, partial [Pyrinomonadaceae bacterium]
AQVFVKANPDKQIEWVTVGRKGRDFYRRRDANIVTEYIGLTGKGRVDFEEALVVAKEVVNRFTEDRSIDKVFLIFAEFKSVLTQRIVTEQLLPISKTTETADNDAGQSAQTKDYIYEQEPAEIFSRLLPSLVETQIFRALLESIASEQGARMTAMEAASKNAGELISTLTLNMNRVRQAAITREIIEIVSGASAL